MLMLIGLLNFICVGQKKFELKNPRVAEQLDLEFGVKDQESDGRRKRVSD